MSNGLIALIVVLVAADILVTGILIRYLKRKTRREGGPSPEAGLIAPPPAAAGVRER